MQDRDYRFEILARGDAAPIMALAEEILATARVEVLISPRVGTLMLRHREPVADTLFNAGEVLVTEALVALESHRGYAMRLGREPEVTLAAAVIDVAAAAAHPLTPRIEALLGELAAAQQSADIASRQVVLQTRVAFEEMGQ